MKKLFKYTGIFIIGLILLLVISLVLARFVFKDALVDLTYKMLAEEWIITLQSAEKYKTDSEVYTFSLLAPRSESVKIREYFQLDELTKNCKSTWDKTLCIAKIAAQIEHNNPNSTPCNLNAIELWEWSKINQSGINCRHHSILLHEMLLSVGIANRVITCTPKDTTDRDCHVVNNVWLPEIGKWIMIDSDKCCYATDIECNLLSLEDMRNKIINHEPIIFNAITTGFVKDKNLYYYWAKNLYSFNTIETQTYGVEDSLRTHYRCIYLVPEKEHIPKGYIPQYSILTTDNNKFWMPPTPVCER